MRVDAKTLEAAAAEITRELNTPDIMVYNTADRSGSNPNQRFYPGGYEGEDVTRAVEAEKYKTIWIAAEERAIQFRGPLYFLANVENQAYGYSIALEDGRTRGRFSPIRFVRNLEVTPEIEGHEPIPMFLTGIRVPAEDYEAAVQSLRERVESELGATREQKDTRYLCGIGYSAEEAVKNMTTGRLFKMVVGIEGYDPEQDQKVALPLQAAEIQKILEKDDVTQEMRNLPTARRSRHIEVLQDGDKVVLYSPSREALERAGDNIRGSKIPKPDSEELQGYFAVSSIMVSTSNDYLAAAAKAAATREAAAPQPGGGQ